MIELTQEQKENIKQYISGYNDWPKKEENMKEHREHCEFFKNKLSKENIDKINEEGLREIYKKLWASNIWGNKWF